MKNDKENSMFGGVDCIGLALELESLVNRVHSQTIERAMRSAANGLRLLEEKQWYAMAKAKQSKETSDVHKSSPSPVCPYCGHVEHDAWEIDFGPSIEGDTEKACGDCGKDYFVSRRATIHR